MVISKQEKERRTQLRKELLGLAKWFEKSAEDNREIPFNMDSKDDYYKIIDSKKY